MNRDTQFAGFARKLERDLHFLAFRMYHSSTKGDEVIQAQQKMIAQRVYDLVQHTVSETTGSADISHVPDMTVWPEGTNK